MHRAKKTTITDLNQHLTCKLCKGYFIDATTIIECLHSFCRSCIVKYLEKNKYCPVCDVQVHKTKPLLNIRPDQTLQNIVYKLVPRLYQNEIQRRRDFYLSHPESGPDQMEENYQHIVVPDESISLTMCYYGCKESARYLRCPAAVSVGHLQKLIRAKYGLFDNHHVDILYNQDCLNSALTLMDVAYIYSWKRKAPLELSYRIYQYTAKKLKLEEKCEEKSEEEKKEEIATPTTTTHNNNNNNNNWKEVQLRISENGEMSIIQDEALELVNNNNYKPEIVTIVDNNKVTKKELPELKFIGKCVTIQEPVIPTSCVSTSCVTLSTSTSTKTVFSTINTSKCSVSSEPPKRKIEEEEKKPDKPEETNKNNQNSTTEKGVKRKLDPPTVPEQPIKQQKQTILNHSLGLHNLSNNHPLKKHSQSNQQKTEPPSDEFTKPKTNPVVGLNRPGTPKPVSKPCYMPKPVINVPKPGTSVAGGVANAKPPPKPLPAPVCSTNQTPPAQNKLIKSKASTPIGYKTLRDPPKSWNSQIAKANVNKPVPDPKYADLKNVRPAKFFKMRNNMPRYLGNPASGVKPMYQVHVSPEKEKKPSETTPKGEIKKHSIVKIDPKTLKPISEKAPETSSLSNSSASTTTSTDLKINTSSVSIFNPLKLQNSPKERKSPKSPHSPKTTSTAAKVPSSPPNKREKLNLNFTPSNPFIPNLTSPTVSPNQFLYPPGPPGFPSYDPRVMAAYHNLFYGQRMGFPPPGLNLDLNRGKNFELPKVGGLPQLKMPSQVHSTTSSTTTSTTATTTTNSSTTYKPVVKKSKESSNKSEKSLQNAVEKLTQNRVKEIKNEAAAAMKTTSTTTATTTTVTVTTSASVSVAATTTTTTTSSKKPEEEKKEEEKIDDGDNQTKKITESEEKSSKTSTEATVETATVTEKDEEKAKTAEDQKNDKKTVSDAKGEVQVKKDDDNKDGDDKK